MKATLLPPIRSILAFLCAIITLAAWTLASPIGSSPDDNFHLPSIWCGRGNVEQQCSIDTDDSSVLVPKPLLRATTCFAFNVAQSAACQSVTQDWSKKRFAPAPWNNTKAQIYPPGFYYVMSFLIGEDAQVSVLIMRALNNLLVLVLFGGLIALARGTEVHEAAIFTPLTISVPLGLFLLSSNNPSSWTILGVGTYWGYLYLLSQETHRSRSLLLWLGSLLAALLALSSRVDGSVYIILATCASLLSAAPSLRALAGVCKRASILSLIIPVTALAVYSFVNLGQGVTIAQAGLVHGTTVTRTVDQLIFYNLIYLPSLWSGALGGWGLGWLDTAISPTVPLVVFSVAFCLIVAGLQGASKGRLLAFWVIVLALTLIPMYVLTRAGHLVGETVQPRYILPLLYPAMGLALVRERGSSRYSFSAKTISVLMVLLSLAHAIALHQNIRRYVTGTEVIDIDLDNGMEWWWPWQGTPTPLSVWIAGSLAYAIMALLLARSTSARRA